MPPSFAPSQTIAIIGAGAMGRGIAQVAAQAGYNVIVADLADAALSLAQETVAKDLATLVSKGKLSAQIAEQTAARMSWTTDYGQLKGASLVIEAILEDATVKAQVFATLEGIVSPETVLATNTSSLSVTALARGLKHPERFAGLHFFNPATVMKLVEIVAGSATSPNIVTALTDLVLQWKKVPVTVRDVPGFIVNRVARPFYAEGFRALTEGAATPEVIDHILRDNGGFRMGPLELSDLIGHDVNFAVAQSIYSAYFGQTRFLPQSSQGDLVAAGRLGRKTGRGFYDYQAGIKPVSFLPEGAPWKGPLPDLSDDRAMNIDGVHIQTTDGRSALRVSTETGRPVALLDWSRAPATAGLAIAVSDDSALPAAQKLASAFGKTAILMADRPGLLALRTMCQLANAGADAVRDQVASAKDVDIAMVNGVNHPAGPLATAQAYGAARVVKALRHIAEETGEAIYQPSECLQRMAWRAA